MQGLDDTVPPPPTDRITALARSVDLSGVTPFLSPVTFFLSENLWPATVLSVSLALVLLTTMIVVGWCRDA
jgi:hypothetical protein